MKARTISAAILVTTTALAGCAPRVRATNATPLPAEKLAEIWQVPDDLSARDLFHGAGGASLAPGADATYNWLATDATGYSPGYDVRGADGRRWSVKLGPEAQTEVVASRVLWALGYHQPPTYYVRGWQLSGGPGGRAIQDGARFRLESDDAEVVGEWSWEDNDFIGTQPYQGLIVANIFINSWDWKTSNNKIYRITKDGTPVNRYVVRDLGASFGRTSPSRLLWILPVRMRGFGQGSRNDIDGFEAQRFIKRFDENTVEFDFHTIYGSVVDLVRPADVKWTVQLLNRVTDAQWDDAFRAADYRPEVRARFVKKIKAKIAEGLAVS
jgi:hypothetical protein